MDDLVKQLMHATVSIDGDFDVGCNVRDAAVERLERADAATAAAFEVAARVLDDEIDLARIAFPQAVPILAADRKAIRALATPDQTAALDRLIAEAEARVWEKAAEIANDHTPEKHGGATLAAHVNGRNIEAAILAASKKSAP